MSKNIDQIFIANPASSMQATDLIYIGRSPYGLTNDMAILWSSILTSLNSTFLPLAGGTMSGAINMNSHLINGVTDPVSAQDAATKHYVDQTSLNGTSVYAASAGSLGTVTQSGAGVGATLTNAGVQAVLALDGVNPPVGTDVLIKNTATGMTSANEGIYTVTDAGSIITNWVLTRATSYDTAIEINDTGLIVIRNGSTLAGQAWYNAATIVTVDTTSFSYSEFGNIVFPISLAHGGTNANLTANAGGIVWSDATKFNILDGTATANQILMSGITNAPAWSTATYPATTTINQLLYSSAANTIVGLATVNLAGLLTDGSGVPAWVTATGTGAPVLGTSPTITTPKIVTAINDANGNTVLGFTATASAVNYIQIANAATTFGPIINATGTDTNIPLSIAAKGTGSINFLGEGGSTTILSLQSVANAVNNFYMINNATGLSPVFGASGSDASVPLLFQSKGGVYYFQDNQSTTGAEIRLQNALASQYTGFKAANAQATTVTFTVPAADGTNAALWSNGSGILSFGTFANSNITSMTGLTGVLQAPTAIASSAGLSVLEFAYTASAVNHLYVQNGTTGVGPGKVALSVTGSDSAIPITISPKNSDLYLTDNTLTIAPALRFYNAAKTHYTGLKVATAQSTDLTLTLPAADGANLTFMQTNGSGVLLFANPTIAQLTDVAYTSYTPTYTGFVDNSLGTTGYYKRIGRTCHVYMVDPVNGTSNSTAFTISLPVTAGAQDQYVSVAQARNNSAFTANASGLISANGTTLTMNLSGSATGWTNSGNKSAFLNFSYETA